MIKRVFDIVVSLVVLILFLPVFVILSILIVLDSNGEIFYKQIRVGKGSKDFVLYKFRTMHSGADQKGLLTIGTDDARITKVGRFIRKYKLDEFPQFFNVLKGDMSVVGPRPEVREYVNLYTPDQLEILSIKPGITDESSVKFSNENELLSTAADPKAYYIQHIMPLKIKMGLDYMNKAGLITDVKILIQTAFKILKQ